MSPTLPSSIRQAEADRVGFKLLEDGRKGRVFKSNGEPVNNRPVGRVCNSLQGTVGRRDEQEVRLQVGDGSARITKITLNMGCG